MITTAYRLKIAQAGLALSSLCFDPAAQAVHLDVEIWGEGNAMSAGFCRTTAVGCDLAELAADLQLPPNTLPRDGANGKLIFLADFRDFAGGPYATLNPGFQSVQNGLSAGEIVSYRAVGVLEYWNPALASWAFPPAGTRVRLFGGLEASSVIINDSIECGGALFCFSGNGEGEEGSTIFTANDIQGSAELLVDAANSAGSLHTHMQFFLENEQGQKGGPAGAYLIEMEVFSNLRLVPSEPFLVLFNAGLSKDDYTDALLALSNKIPDIEPPPPGPSPTADAGSDRVVRIGNTVTLDGGNSQDPQPGPEDLSFQWSQNAGPSITVLNANQQLASFVAGKPGLYRFNLTISDGFQASTDAVSLTVPIRGDVDLDGDVDRIDVALILRGAQKKLKDNIGNDVRDIDCNGVISRNDALLAKKVCTLRLCRPIRR